MFIVCLESERGKQQNRQIMQFKYIVTNFEVCIMIVKTLHALQK